MKPILKLIAIILILVILPFITLIVLGEEDIVDEENICTHYDETCKEKYIKNIYILQDSNITSYSITKHNKKLQWIDYYTDDENFTLNQDIIWIKVILNSLKKGHKYILDTEHYKVIESNFSPKEQANSFTIANNFYTSFIFQKNNIFYLKLENHDYHHNLTVSIIDEEILPLVLNLKSDFIFFIGIIFGLIFMVAIYNLSLFYFNRKSAFLFYALMQFGMSLLLLIDSHLFLSIEHFNSNIIILLNFIFALLFSRSFLETKKYLPIIDKIIFLLILLTTIDMIYSLDYIIHYRLLTFITLFILILGFIRVGQNYRPANFFVIGWFFIFFSVYTLEYAQENVMVNFLYLGSTIEAIMLALALSLQMHQLKEEKERQTEVMYHQNRLASLGDMLGNISHQWRQPLNRLAYICMNIEKLTDSKKRSHKLYEANKQLAFMSQTIEDFRNFYAPSKQKESFSLAEESLKIIEFIHYKRIEVVVIVKEDSQIFNYKNEFKQVLLNLLSNAKDVLIERKIEEPKILIFVEKNKVTVQDNAGGIKLKNIEQIFEPYFTTKEQGMGIGLYMSKIIIEKNMGGKLEFQNIKDGAQFILSFA